MTVDVLVAEIGSTTTVVNAFGDLDTDTPKFLGQGQSPTTVLEGDVNLGLMDATYKLQENLGISELGYDKFLATSSAAGGLKMTVHGLMYEMTAKAAKEAALGAGANIHMVTSGKLRRTDLKEIEKIKPNIILLAGGVDYGERDTAIYNAEMLVKLPLNVPVIYAGNIQNHEEIKLIFEEAGKLELLRIVENVYPKVDVLNVEPVRKVIQDVFEEHIIHAPGMERVKEIVNGPIIPTPGAVMESSKILKEAIGDLVTVDVGGATTDVHSVADGDEVVLSMLISPEPVAKRTVEGDLGVYVNLVNVVEIMGKKLLREELNIGEKELEELLINFPPIPKTPLEIKLVEILTEKAVILSIHRHAGGYKHLFGETKKTLAEGKDLTSVKWIIGTGGALTRLPNRVNILEQISISKLLPRKEAKILIDNDYIMASLGVLSKYNKKAALKLLEKSLNLREEDTWDTQE
jgi:uncharacterized protein (TIGR01319 family)